MFSFRFFHLLLSPFVTYRREAHFVQNRKHARERFLTESKPIVFSIRNPLYSHEPEKKIKNYEIHLSSHFCLRAHYKSTLQQELGLINSLRDSYLKSTSNVNLFPMSIIRQHRHPTSKYCSSMILPPVLDLGCLRFGKGTPPIHHRNNVSTKQLLKRHKLTEW